MSERKNISRAPDDGGFDAGAVGGERRFDLGRSDAVAAHVDHVVHSARDCVESPRIAPAAVPREVVPLHACDPIFKMSTRKLA